MATANIEYIIMVSRGWYLCLISGRVPYFYFSVLCQPPPVLFINCLSKEIHSEKTNNMSNYYYIRIPSIFTNTHLAMLRF